MVQAARFNSPVVMSRPRKSTSTPKPMGQKAGVCKICKQLRYFLVVAACLMALMWVQPNWRLPGGFDYNILVGDLFLWAFVSLFVYKLWEYQKNKHKQPDADEEWRPPTPEEFELHRRRTLNKQDKP